MELIHIGLVASCEDNASRFYHELLGLALTRRSELPEALASRLFGLEKGCEILYFGNDAILFEVFVTGWPEKTERKISHTCIEVEDRGGLLARAGKLGFEVIEAPRNDYSVYFLSDRDGNLFEVKETR